MAVVIVGESRKLIRPSAGVASMTEFLVKTAGTGRCWFEGLRAAWGTFVFWCSCRRKRLRPLLVFCWAAYSC